MTDAGARARSRASLAITALSLGTALNPLNSSMIAVALLALQRDFALDLGAVTWVITVFYITSIVGQPLMGRVIDALGARRVFIAGLLLVLVAAVLAPAGGSFALVLVSRGLMALGTSVAFPAAIALVGPLAEAGGIPTARLIARVQVTNTAAAAAGPVLGGLLVAAAGWQAVFLVNLPLALAAIAGVWHYAPRDRPHVMSVRALLGDLDLIGVAAFAAATVALVLVALGAAGTAVWWVAAAGVAAACLFVWRELRAPHPFIDLRMLARNRTLVTVYLSFTVFTAMYYLAFFGLPQLLEGHGGFSPAITGLLVLPLAASTVLLAPVVARLLERHGVRTVTIWGAGLLLLAAGLLGIGVVTTGPWWMLVMAAAMGAPYCVVSLAATQALQRAAPAHMIGTASGLLQAARYLGAIAATVLLGRLLRAGITPESWAAITVAAVAIAVLHLAIVLVGMRRAAV